MNIGKVTVRNGSRYAGARHAPNTVCFSTFFSTVKNGNLIG